MSTFPVDVLDVNRSVGNQVLSGFFAIVTIAICAEDCGFDGAGGGEKNVKIECFGISQGNRDQEVAPTKEVNGTRRVPTTKKELCRVSLSRQGTSVFWHKFQNSDGQLVILIGDWKNGICQKSRVFRIRLTVANPIPRASLIACCVSPAS